MKQDISHSIKYNNMEKILTFRTVQDALNYALDNNLFRLDLVDMENDLKIGRAHV